MHLRKPSPGTAIALLALFFAMGGTAIAAHHYLITSTKQIKPSVLKTLRGNKGASGLKGETGLKGEKGEKGETGVKGETGLRGPGIVASADSGETSCELSEENTFCYPEKFSFSPSAEAKCLVTVFSQIESTEPGKPTTSGPYFRIAIKENATQKNDGEYGHYFEGTDGFESTDLSRTRYLTVKPGTTYTFGAFYGAVSGEWKGKLANFELTYTCFGS